jgi:hypothetical protein
MKFNRKYQEALFITILKRELWPLIGIIDISKLKLMSSTPERQ